jgi:HSP20 family protein
MAAKQARQSGAPAPRGIFSELDPFRDFFDRPLWMARLLDLPMRSPGASADWSPAMDVTESKNAYVVTLELPGMSKDDIAIECHDDVLTVRGEKKSEREETEEHRHFTERTFGAFSRSLRLPADASEDVKATFREGVLTVTIAKVGERRPRVVSIES